MKKILLFILVLLSLPAHADVEQLAEKVRKIVLDNGFTCLLVKRGEAPIFSAYLRVKVGNIEEPEGATGLAHFFEHMAFKGTSNIGVKNYKAEKKVLDKIHTLGSRIVQMQKDGASEEELEPLRQKLLTLEEADKKLVVPNEFINIYQRNGGTDMNATTGNDFTSYFVSLPANRLELWAYMESDRLMNTVMREFYSEKDVVAEERRMRTDNDPDGRLYEFLMKTAFENSPYKNPVVGWPEDIKNFNVEEARAFHSNYYIPSRMVLAVVGNFDLDEAENVVKKYFGQLPAKPDKPIEVQPENLGTGYPKVGAIQGTEEPRFYLSYHRPAHPHPDDEVLDVLQNILCEGRTSRLYKKLVLEKKMVSSIDCYASIPGSRLDGLFSFYAKPLPPYTSQQVEAEILKEITLVKNTRVTPTELEKVKNTIKASTMWTLKSNMGLASLLTFFESLTGNWQYILSLEERVDAISTDDIQRVAKTYFVPSRQVSTYLDKEEK